MKSRTIRVIVVLAMLACAGIITTQVYWVRKAYALSEQRFNLNVNVALRNMASAILRDQGLPPMRYSPVEQVSPGCFTVQINAHVEKTVLEDQLAAALTAQNVVTDFQYGLSANNQSGAMEYAGDHHMPGSGESSVSQRYLPSLKRENHYIAVCFPNRRSYLLSEMTIWAISSIVLLLVMGFLCYLLWVIFKQRRLSEVQKDFVANMTHEFKTPLASIRLSADVLKNPGILKQPQRLLNYATIISNEAMQLTAHVERVLQMSKAEREGLQLNRSEFVWQDVLREELKHYSNLAIAKNGVVSMQLPDRPLKFNGDILHLKNALNNLVDNAVKYCVTRPEIQIILKNGEGRVSVAVRDNGMGIDKTQQGMLFDKFFRVHTGNVHDVKGFGIGLNYVRIIARAHGGEVTCNSQLGKGSTFTLILPLT
jgi:two-component system phosphate regulon sensor histidine kinase PhoR